MPGPVGPIHYLNPGDQPSPNPRYFKNNPPYPDGSLTGGSMYPSGTYPPAMDPTQAYNDYLRRLQQQYQNQYQTIMNTVQQQQGQNQLSSLGLNFAGDTANQQMRGLQLSGDIGQLGMQQNQARQRAQMNIAQEQFQRQQQRLAMQDDLQRQQYQRATQSVPNPFMQAMASLNGRGY